MSEQCELRSPSRAVMAGPKLPIFNEQVNGVGFMNSSSAKCIWESFGGELRRFVQSRVNNEQDSQDILQDLYMKIHRKIHTLRDEKRLTSWLYQVARNTIIDHFRRSKNATLPLPEKLIQECNPENKMRTEAAGWLKGIIEDLPEKYRQAIILSEFEGLSQKEVAERLGLTLSGAKSRIQRGRKMIRESILNCCHLEFDSRGDLIGYERRPCCQNGQSPGRNKLPKSAASPIPDQSLPHL